MGKGLRIIKLLAVILLALTPTQAAFGSGLNLPIQVKETAGVGATAFPTIVVVPMPKGKYFKTTPFRMTDSNGNSVDAQFSILNKWWADDNSIRHLLVQFKPTVAAYTGTPGTGETTYYLKDDSVPFTNSATVTVSRSSNIITVNTGPLVFTINTSLPNIIDTLSYNGTQLINSSSNNGGFLVGQFGDRQQDTARSDVTYTIEESGPLRAIIKMEAPTLFTSASSPHTHGFAIRVYAYAGQPFIKIDYQLRNAHKDYKYGWPLYFKEMGVTFGLKNLGSTAVECDPGTSTIYSQALGNGIEMRQSYHWEDDIVNASTGATIQANGSSFFTNTYLNSNVVAPFLDVDGSTAGVQAVLINQWQMFPSGVKVDSSNNLTFNLWPEWSSHWDDYNGDFEYVTHPGDTNAHLHWLEDMQSIYRTMYLNFHPAGASAASLQNFAKTVQSPPVAVVPTSQYEASNADLDMGGFIPFGSPLADADTSRRYSFNTGANGDFTYTGGNPNTYYNFGYDNFYFSNERLRKHNPGTAGGAPKSVGDFIATPNPANYQLADMYSLADINVMPEVMANYNYANDFPTLGLNSFSGTNSWRAQGGSYPNGQAAALLQTGSGASLGWWSVIRDDEHGWYYHVEEAYDLTANPWIKDWYEFIDEFRKDYLTGEHNDWMSRAVGHGFSNALQAYRVTGDTSILSSADSFINTQLRPKFNMTYGYKNDNVNGATGSGANACAQVYSGGYMLRALISYAEEVKNSNWQEYVDAYSLIAAYIDYNHNITNFNHEYDPTRADTSCSGSTDTTNSNLVSWTLCDPQAWYYMHNGSSGYRDQLLEYINTGIPPGVGDTPATVGGSLTSWSGGFAGRWSSWVYNNTKANTTPPAAITNLSATNSGSSVTLHWTAPSTAYRYIVSYSNKPFTSTYNTNGNVTSLLWWGGKVLGPSFKANPGGAESYTFTSALSGTVYVTLLSIDTPDSQGDFNLSAISNVASVSISGSGGPYTVTASAGSNGSISPGSQSIPSGSNSVFTVQAYSGYTASVGGTCGGNLVGNTYTTNPITADCTVTSTFSPSSPPPSPPPSPSSLAPPQNLRLVTAKVSVPNVVGLAQSAATAAITGAGLAVGAVTTQSSTTVPSGSVLSQNPAAGTSLGSGSAVSLFVSSGAPPPSSSKWTIENMAILADTYDYTMDGPALQSLGIIDHIALGGNGEVYFTLVRQTDVYVLSNGVISHLAGNGNLKRGFRNGPAGSAMFNPGGGGYSYYGIAADKTSGAVYVADGFNERIRKIYKDTNGNWMVSTYAGGGDTTLSPGQSAPATSVNLGNVVAVAVDGDGNVYTSPWGKLVKITPGGTATCVLAYPTEAYGRELDVVDLAADSSGNVYGVGRSPDVYFEVTKDGQFVPTVQMARGMSGTTIDGPVATATFYCPDHVNVDPTGTAIYGGGGDELVLRRIQGGQVSTLQQDGSWLQVQAFNKGWQLGCIMAVDPGGFLWIGPTQKTGIPLRKLIPSN